MKNAKKTFPLPQKNKEVDTTTDFPDYPVSEAIYNRLEENEPEESMTILGSDLHDEQEDIRRKKQDNTVFSGNRLDNLDEN